MKKILSTSFVVLLTGMLYGQKTFPINDVEFVKNEKYALIHATIVKDAASAPMEDGTLIIDKGKIIAMGHQIPVPTDALVKDCKGKMIYPSFIDVYTDLGMPAVGRAAGGGFGGPSQAITNAKTASSWNQAIKPEQQAASIFQANETKAKDLRANGFGLVNTHVQDGIVRGTGALVSLENNRSNLVLIKEKSSAHYSFNKGSSTQDYPTSLMGSIALLRQTFLDGRWYKNLSADKTKQIKEEGTNLSLAAFNELQTLPQFFEAGDKWNDLRAHKIAKEFNTQFILVGGGNEYQRILDIKTTGAQMVLPINFPAAQDVEDPLDARLVALADMKHWELAPSNPAALEKAGISFALSQHGLRESASFNANLIKAIQSGLSESTALKALTSIPAQMLGIQDLYGSLAIGKMANLIITNGPLFKEKTSLLENWIHGTPYSIKAEGWIDHRGEYTLHLNNQKYALSISGDAPGSVAKIVGPDTVKADIKFNDKLVLIHYSFKADSAKSNRLTGVEIGEGWNGTGTLANGDWIRWTINKNKSLEISITAKKDPPSNTVIPDKMMYPFQSYGWMEPPSNDDLLIKGATIWTSEKTGKLENTDLLIQKGKIVRIGKNIQAGTVRVLNATGKHVTAGIIDEHSHIAGTGSINECSQSVTSEVRIADIINPDDVNIYRQLSGGVTSSHILHGSCNTIGGQTQLIKMRWGKNAEEMKFEGWPGFIKFALGENVKRASNNQNTRFPDTRMGVEQVLEDAFLRAKKYAANTDPYKRKDLELDALVEIVNNQRHITCHSYVATEILAILSVAEKHGFKVNTFTHILEGYKVADQMKKQGSAAAGFSDWWAYKREVRDAIPQNAYIMDKVGVLSAINSDDAEMARRLNQEAAKSIKYAGSTEEEALQMITINPATMLHVADKTGSIKVGKDADIVIWSDHPLSIYAKAEKTIVDGIIYFDREKDAEQQKWIAAEKNRLIQKMVGAKRGGARTTPANPSFQEEEHCEEDHPHGNNMWHRLQSRMIQASNH